MKQLIQPLREWRTISGVSFFVGIFIAAVFSPSSYAEKPVFDIVIENHLFQPSVLEVPANVKIKLVIHNKDDTPEEFESYELNREKIIVGGQTAIVFVGPLKPGEYPFFGEFNPKTAQGKIVARE